MKKIALFILISSSFMFSCQKQIDYQPQINDINNNISALQKSRDSLANALALTNTNIAVINKGLDSIRIQLNNINSQIALLNSQMITANANIASLTSQLSVLNQQYADLLAKFNSLLGQLNIIPPFSLTTGLVAYYPFTGNSNDSSGYGNNGINSGAILTTDRNGINNRAYYFNGVNSKIIVSTFNKITGNNPFSVSFWASPESSNGWLVCFGKSENGNAFECGTHTYGSPIFDALIWKYDHYPNTKVQLTLNKYQYITVTYDGSIMSIYLNGILSVSNKVDYITPNILSGILSFGKQIDFEEYYKGKLDDVRIYNRVLSQSEISYLSTN